LFWVIFCHGHQQYVSFFAALYLPQDGGSELFCSNSGGDPLYALFEGALGQQAFASSNFIFMKKQKAFFHCQLLKLAAEMAAWATAWQKTSSVQTCLVF
jgi:hypothetical protein